MRPPSEKQPTHPITTALKAIMNAKTKEKLDIALTKYFKGDHTQPAHAACFALNNRWKGKDGFFRKQILGRRCNFTARAVCTPDPALPAGTVALPKAWAKTLTPHCVAKEAMTLPRGAMVQDGNRLVKSSHARAGQTYVRPLQDDDQVLLNRQPSLHTGSMLCMKTKLIEGNTIRFSPAHCKSLNADFDGDEVNIHLLQREDAKKQAHEKLKPQMVTAAMQDTATRFEIAEGSAYDFEDWQRRQDAQDAHGLSVTLADIKTTPSSSLLEMVKAGKGKNHHITQIRESFMDGMTSKQLFENATKVRKGLVGTYCSTPEAGYLARKLCALLEDVHVKNNLLVNASNCVIAFDIEGISNSLRPGVQEAQTIAHELTQSYLDAFHNVGGASGTASDALRVVNGPPKNARVNLPPLTLYQAVYNFVRTGEAANPVHVMQTCDDFREALAGNLRATTNNLDFVAETLGIEACRAQLLKLLPRRKLYADCVTAGGKMLYANRKCIQKTYEHPLAAAAFETALPTLVQACNARVTDPLQHPTSQIVVHGFPSK